ncbi:hypothetical protein MATL_G00206300 [Megalops atlanticus]|uniref:Ig-like domain-containing protein n=1 Tax=Megalops atlanticus TaxID=7932 RepID=A0A9D3SYQ9_MEGAT|nr:hypothetical protein MATL_G00206300 [Megalops atlanticus]
MLNLMLLTYTSVSLAVMDYKFGEDVILACSGQNDDLGKGPQHMLNVQGWKKSLIVALKGTVNIPLYKSKAVVLIFKNKTGTEHRVCRVNYTKTDCDHSTCTQLLLCAEYNRVFCVFSDHSQVIYVFSKQIDMGVRILVALSFFCFSESTVLVKIGESVTLSCNVTVLSDQLLMYWEFSSQNASSKLMEDPPSNITEGYFNLTLSSVKFSDEGTYTCYAQKANGSAECLAKHDVRVSGFAEDAQKKFGDSLYISLYNHTQVKIQHSPTGYMNAVDVCTLKETVFKCTSEFKNRVTAEGDCLMLKKVTPADMGQFMVSDPSGNNISIVALTVEASKREHVEPAGSHVTIPVPSQGTAVLQFHPTVYREPFELCWMQDGKGHCLSDYSISVMEEKLKVHSLSPQNHGRYVVILKERNITFSDISVTVKGHKESITLEPGATLSINFYTHTPVVVLFKPSSDPQWNRTILNNTEVHLENVKLCRGYLILKGVSLSHQGTYSVEDLSGEHLYNTVDVTVSESIYYSTEIGMPYFEKIIGGTASEPEYQESQYFIVGVVLLVILVIGVIGLIISYKRINEKTDHPHKTKGHYSSREAKPYCNKQMRGNLEEMEKEFIHQSSVVS